MRARTLLVVLVAVLAIASMPASAQNASAVASQHTTFGTGGGEPAPTTLQNMSVQSSGESASIGLSNATGTIESVEDGDLKEYGGDTGAFTTTTSVAADGSTAIESSGKIGNYLIASTTGLSTYPERGDNISARLRAGQQAGTMSFGFGMQDTKGWDAASGYLVLLNPTGSADLYRLDSGSLTQLASIGDFSFDTFEWYRVDVAWRSGGAIAVSVYNETGAEVASNEVTDETYDSGGIAWHRGGQTSSNTYQFDYVQTTERASAGRYVGAPHDAESVSAGWTNLTLQNATATATWQEDADADGVWTNVTSTTYTTGGNKTADLSGTTSDRWRVRVDVDATDSNATARINDEGVLFASSNPSFSDPEPPDQAKIENAVGNVSINVSDSDFGLVQGDNVSVSATDDDGTSLGSATLTSDGRVSVPYSSENGRNVIDWSATDEYGNTITFQQTFTTPSQLIVKNESAPSQTVNNSGTITATFFGDEGKTVVERSTTNGRFNLTGLPTDTTYIVQIDVNGFRSRQVVITSLFDQQTVFLLPDDAPAAQVQYILDDKTGEFAAQETRLFIDTAIRKNNSTEFRTIFADEFGASGDLRVTLRDDTRYRIRVRSPGSGERVLGSYTASGADTVTLEIGQLSFAVREQGDQSFNVSAETVTGSNETVQAVRFNYDDPTEQTSRINVSVETLNGTVVGQAQATNEPYGSFSFTQPTNNSTAANATFTVKFEVTRAGETVSGQLRPGLNRYPPGVPLDNGLKQLFSVGFLLIVGGLFSATNARVGAVVTPLFAVGLWYVEWLPPGTSILAIALALGVGVLVNYGGRR